MLRVLLCGVLVLATAGSAVAEWKLSEFMITQWGQPDFADDEAVVQAAAAAHVNHLMWTADKLDLCQTYGVKLIVTDPSPELARRIASHPALFGYYGGDEPYPESKFPPLAEQKRALQKVDAEHPYFINMLSTTGDFLRTYMRVVQPEILSFDFYQWLWGSDRYYEKLEQFREEAMMADVPLTSCIETETRPVNGPDYLPDNAQKLRLSVYTALAYGAKGIQWYHARGMYEKDSLRLSKAGEDVKALNLELTKIGAMLVNLRSTDVYNTMPLPKGTREAPKENWIQLIGEENAGGLVLGMFKDESNEHFMDDVEVDYFMATNRDYQNSQHVVVRFQTKWLGIAPWYKPKQFTRSVEIFDKKTGEWKMTSSSCAVGFIFYIEPADGELFRVTTTITDGGES
ncbi:MAG: hypothetical protein HOH74_32940 [Gemmatimonadetes bacterium]|jgi:hypothetical protein|nr:hypothetical protein [Gemmatimonadota bacterium]